MLVAGIGLLRRRMWGIRLAIAAAAAKIVRLVLLYSYVALAIVPPIAQGSGRMAFEATMQQQKAMGGTAGPAHERRLLHEDLLCHVYGDGRFHDAVRGDLSGAVALVLEPARARAACDPKARHDREVSETRALGITNIVFAACLILFGLCLGTYIAAIPVWADLGPDPEEE